MPYGSKADLPPAAKKLPEHAQSIFMRAFNAAHKQYKGDEEKAFAVAWAAVKQKYKQEGGKWVTKDQALLAVCDPDSDEYDPDECEAQGGDPGDYGDSVRWRRTHSITPDSHEVIDTMDFEETYALDAAEIRETKDGYLVCSPRVARTGIQLYKGSNFGLDDDSMIRIYRSPEEVFHADALQTLAHRPITIGHPDEHVNAKNWRQHAIGMTGDEVARDGDFIRVPMLLMDAEAVKKTKARELSVGYSSDIVWTSGVTADGQEYDAIQRNIRANHIAIVAQARGGPKLRLGDNRGDTTMPLDRATLTRTITVDGIEVTLPDTEAAIVLRTLSRHGDEMKTLRSDVEKLTKSLADSVANVEKLTKDIQTKDGEILGLKKKVEDATIKPEDLDKRVRERTAVVDAAVKVMGKDYKAEGKADIAIKKEVVEKKLGDAAKGLSDDAINGAFTAVTAGVVADQNSGVNRLAQNLSQNITNTADGHTQAKTAWEERQKRTGDAWQNLPAQVQH